MAFILKFGFCQLLKISPQYALSLRSMPALYAQCIGMPKLCLKVMLFAYLTLCQPTCQIDSCHPSSNQ